MKFFVFFACLLSCSSLSFAATDEKVLALYQELCAKEPDPVKRHNYCYLLENSDRSHSRSNVFRQDTAIA